MAGSDAPNIVSLGALAFAGAVAGLTGWFERRKSTRESKREDTPDEGQARLVAGSIIDARRLGDVADGLGRVVREITEFREQQHADSRAMRAVMEENNAELKRNTAAQDQGAATPRDLLALIAKLERKP